MGTRGPSARYPYRLWADGEWHSLTRGEDYRVQTAHFRIALNTWARNNEKSVEFRNSSTEGVEVRFRDGGPYCKYCDSPYVKRSSNHQYCEDCVPQGNPAATMRMSNYRLPQSVYLRMYEEQEGLCMICRLWQAEVVDHDHTCCGPVKTNGPTCGDCTRRLLCTGCNINIEKYETDEIYLKKARPHVPAVIAYLKAFGTPESKLRASKLAHPSRRWGAEVKTDPELVMRVLNSLPDRSTDETE